MTEAKIDCIKENAHVLHTPETYIPIRNEITVNLTKAPIVYLL